MLRKAQVGDPIIDSGGKCGVISFIPTGDQPRLLAYFAHVIFVDGEKGIYDVEGSPSGPGTGSTTIQLRTGLVQKIRENEVPLNLMSRGEKPPLTDDTLKMIDDTLKANILAQGESSNPDYRYDGNICWVPFAYHLLPVEGLAKVAAVMRIGEMSGRPDYGWRKVPVMEQVNHAISHLMSYVAGRHDNHHLANAACRVLMALDMDDKEPLPQATDSPEAAQESDGGPDGPTLME